MAITWRNVDAPNLGDPTRTLLASQNSFNQAFQSLGDIAKSYQANDAANWEQVRQNNTDAFLTRLNQATTPEELKALQASGELDRMRERAGAQIDLARTQDAFGQRLSTLQQRAVAETNFNNLMADQRLGPELQQALMAASQGREFQMSPELQARKGAEVVTAMMQGRRAATNDTYLANQDARAQLQLDSTISHQKALEQQGAARLDLERQRMEQENAIRQAAADANRTEAAKAQARALIDNAMKNNVYKDGVYTPERSAELMDLLTKNKIGDDVGERQAIINRLNKMGELKIQFTDEKGNPNTASIPLPMSRVKEAVLGGGDDLFNLWNQGYANNVSDTLEDLRKNLIGRSPDGKRTAKNLTLEDYNAYRALQDYGVQATQSPKPLYKVGGTPKK